MKVLWPKTVEDGHVRAFLEYFEDVAEMAELNTDRGRLAALKCAGYLSVEELVHLAREFAEAPLATLPSQEKRDNSVMEDLRTQVGRLTEQLAATKTETRKRTSRCYSCGTPGYPYPTSCQEYGLVYSSRTGCVQRCDACYDTCRY
ncbi:hypothetical protein CSKR_203019 [Clonorchis sinensis]|uniref:Uncharacterized protein n=1 Tax=Clonorchis sinensis TaxID=79923 RepID=A0A8T1M6S8_CLOSI|nr:hypothetical protein CSKR_203019 [Clonorchis sinensis]